jgi:hypothetical protein
VSPQPGVHAQSTELPIEVLQLVAEHKLALEDTVAERYPGVFPYRDQITLRQLLNHTSGIRRNNLDEFPPLAKVIPLIRNAGERARATELARRWARSENVVPSSHLSIAAAATQPLLFPPRRGFITDPGGRRIVVVAANSTGASSGNAKTQLSTALYCRALGSGSGNGANDAG